MLTSNSLSKGFPTCCDEHNVSYEFIPYKLHHRDQSSPVQIRLLHVVKSMDCRNSAAVILRVEPRFRDIQAVTSLMAFLFDSREFLNPGVSMKDTLTPPIRLVSKWHCSVNGVNSSSGPIG
jgi:hypothetical protein